MILNYQERYRARQRGMALPIMLIILVVMLIGSVYVMRASTGTTLVTANLAYDSQLSKATDLGLIAGSTWLSNVAMSDKNALRANNASQGYVASYDPAVPQTSSDFWTGAAVTTDVAGNKVEYVIHRMCKSVGAYDDSANACIVTVSAPPDRTGDLAMAGESSATDGFVVVAVPSVHYVITSRIFGARGANVINQAVVMVGG